MAGATRETRTHRGRARVGSTRWFRRYRFLVVAAWLVAMAVTVWLVFFRVESAPLNAFVVPGEVPSVKPVVGPAKAGPARVNLPADDVPHENVTEWWYYSGHVQTESGERYSFHVATFLRQGGLSHTAFHGSLLDHKSGKHYTDQARTEGKPADGQAGGFGFSFGPWQMAGAGPDHSMKMAGKGFALDLTMKDSGQPVLHQAPGTPVAGLLDFGAAGTSYYTSRPRMRAEGSLIIDGVSRAVSGEVWFDHQWGDFEAAQLRWNWFALQLADGADLMIYELFDRQGAPVLRMGTYSKDGAVHALGVPDFSASARGIWKSPSSGIVYPMDWTITVPGKGLDLKLEPVIRHSQFDARITTLNLYWEGAVKLSGSHGGAGFMELSGYEKAPAKK